MEQYLDFQDGGLNAVNSGTYDPNGVTDDFIKDTETFEIPVFGGKGSGGSGTVIGEDGTAYTPGINPGTQYGPQTGINPYPFVQNRGNTKEVEIIDKDGTPLQNAHITWTESGKKVGTITNAEGIATVEVENQTTLITITYVGKRTHVAAFKDLGSLITLQDNVNNLPPVVIKNPTTKPTTPTNTTPPVAQVDKKSGFMKTAIIGIGALLLISAFSKPGGKGKSGLNGSAEGLSGTKGKKKKKSKKSKKSKGLRQPAEITL
jgi:hypothetical protein